MIDKVRALANQVVYGRAPTEGAPRALKELTLVRLDGTPFQIAEIAGKVVLFVNVASRCGLTPQYTGLVTLQAKYGSHGLAVVGVPCNQFLGQEPGTSEEIATFCSVKYNVDFPLLEKQDVNGAGRSPLYQWLLASPAGRGGDISWNFEKFLVGRDGAVLARFAPQVEPGSSDVVAAIEAALSA